MRRFLLAALLLFAFAPALSAQTTAPPPRLAPPPLLYIKLAGPKGMRVKVYSGSLTPRTIETPAIIGLRPGYRSRIALSEIPGFPNETFHASLETVGSLILTDRLSHADFPAPLTLTLDDFNRAAENATVQRAILLERAEHALPITTSKDVPIEVAIAPNRNLLVETRHLGQPLLVLQMGARKFAPEEMINVPGTMLLPDDKILALPMAFPPLPWNCYPVADPVHGPLNPSDFFALPDGGDTGARAGVLRDGKLVGVDVTDTVAAFTDSMGRRRVACSNRVALCVPRFIVARTELLPAGHTVAWELGARRSVIGESLLGRTAVIDTHTHRAAVEAFGGKTRASAISTEVGLAISGRIQGVVMHFHSRTPAGVDVLCPRPLGIEPPDGCLQVIKWPDKCGASIGDIITFFIRYTNPGGQPMSGILIADSLHPRYEYVPGSAKTDRAANFSTQPNEAGSVQLRWEIQGELSPGEQGVVSFQVKIR